MIWTIVGILTMHFIADFLCQTRTMARNKSTSIKWLSIHVLVYTFVMALAFFVVGEFKGINYNATLLLGLYYIVINGAAHWLTDFVTSKISGYFYKKGNEWAFFGIIGLDQLIHAATLLLTYHYILC